jgi:diacylglycerol kinase family enzyme
LKKSRICFVVNTRSGGKFQHTLIESAREVFSHYACEFLLLSKMEDWHQVYEWNADPSVVALVVVGGDGTANASLSHLLGMVTPVGFLPGGTANDFSRALGFESLELLALRNSIESNKVKAVDVMRANNKYFLTAGGIGLGSDVSLAINESRKSSSLFRWAFAALGSHMYSILALKKVLFEHRKRRFHLRLTGTEGTIEVETSLLLCCNVGLIGKHLNISPRSLMYDGRFETYSVAEAGSKHSVLSSLLNARRGKGLKADNILTSHFLEIESLSGESLAFFGDGEVLLHAKKISLELMPKALNCFFKE